MTYFSRAVVCGHCFEEQEDYILAKEVNCMKKKSFALLAAVMSFLAVPAQKNDFTEGRRSSLAFSAGVAVPIMCYADKDVNDPDAGFAKPGFIFDLAYAYRFSNTVGITGSLFYSWNKAGNNTVKAVSSPGSYRMFGLMAGPLFARHFSNRWEGDIRLLAGFSRVFTPALQQGDALWLDTHEKTAFTWGGGIGLRYNFEGNAFLQLKAEHTNLKPQFSKTNGLAGKNNQHIVLMNFDAGVGVKF